MAIKTQRLILNCDCGCFFSTRLVSASWDCSISESVSWDVVAVALVVGSK